MPFSNINNLRTHLTEFTRTLGEVNDLSLRFEGDAPLNLPHRTIKSKSEKVKGREMNFPVNELISLSTEWSSLSETSPVPESVVVASDQSLSTVYSENVDFTVDYEQGRIQRLESGAISEAQTVSVWYYPYRIYERDIDYQISYLSGSISRLAEGAIEANQIVWIDYEIESGMFADDTLTQVLEEAHVSLLASIAEKHHNSGDRILEVAESYLALAILARMKGMEILQSSVLSSSANSSLAQEYLKLGDSYRKQAENMILPYRKATDALAYPCKIRTDVQKER